MKLKKRLSLSREIAKVAKSGISLVSMREKPYLYFYFFNIKKIFKTWLLTIKRTDF